MEYWPHHRQNLQNLMGVSLLDRMEGVETISQVHSNERYKGSIPRHRGRSRLAATLTSWFHAFLECPHEASRTTVGTGTGRPGIRPSSFDANGSESRAFDRFPLPPANVKAKFQL
jgi:hypothetical protein